MKKIIVFTTLILGMITTSVKADIYTDGLKKLTDLGVASLDTKTIVETLRNAGIDEESCSVETIIDGLIQIEAPYFKQSFSKEQFQQYVNFYSQPQMVALTKKNVEATQRMTEAYQTALMTAMTSLQEGITPKDIPAIACDKAYEQAFDKYWELARADEAFNTGIELLSSIFERQGQEGKDYLNLLIPYIKKNFRTAYKNAVIGIMSQEDLLLYTSVIDQPFYESMNQVTTNMLSDMSNLVSNIYQLLASKIQQAK